MGSTLEEPKKDIDQVSLLELETPKHVLDMQGPQDNAAMACTREHGKVGRRVSAESRASRPTQRQHVGRNAPKSSETLIDAPKRVEPPIDAPTRCRNVY